MKCPFLEYFGVIYQYIFIQYYMFLPNIYNLMNSLIVNINSILTQMHVSIHIPLMMCDCNISSYTISDIEIKIANKDDVIYPIFYRHMILVTSGMSMLTLFSSIGLIMCRTMLLILYPLYETISTIDNLQKKNEWLSYWVFFIIYTQLQGVLEYLFWNDVFELCAMYIVIRYQFLKNYIYHLLLYVNNNKDKSVGDVFEVQKMKIKNNWNLLISKVNT